MEVKAAKKVEREEKEKEEGYKRGGVEVKELWKPHQGSVELFEAMRGRCVFSDCVLYPSVSFTLSAFRLLFSCLLSLLLYAH